MVGAGCRGLRERREPFRWSDEASGQQYDLNGLESSTHHADARAVRPSSAAVHPCCASRRASASPSSLSLRTVRPRTGWQARPV